MSAEEKDWIVDVLYDVQSMLKKNGLTQTADSLATTIQFSLLEIANIDSCRYLTSGENAVNNIVKFTRCKNGQI